eukprot:s819_g19.t1
MYQSIVGDGSAPEEASTAAASDRRSGAPLRAAGSDPMPQNDLAQVDPDAPTDQRPSIQEAQEHERLRVLMLYHLCALLLLCLERVVGFVKGCQELEMEKKLTHREEILKMDCNTYQVRLCIKFVLDAGLMSYFAFIIWSLIVRIEAGELGEPSLLREQELADRALGDPWLFVQTPGAQRSRCPDTVFRGATKSGRSRSSSISPRRRASARPARAWICRRISRNSLSFGVMLLHRVSLRAWRVVRPGGQSAKHMTAVLQLYLQSIVNKPYLQSASPSPTFCMIAMLGRPSGRISSE